MTVMNYAKSRVILLESFHQLDASEELARRIQQLYDEGCPLLDIADKLNGEGYQPAKGERFTQTSMGALAGCCAAKESSQRLHISSRTIGELVRCVRSSASKNRRSAVGEAGVGAGQASW